MDPKHALSPVTITTFLKDGTTIDLTGLPPEVAVDKLQAVGFDQIERTVIQLHGLKVPVRPGTPSITCPFCGFVSYNPHDIAERYCGACHRFQDPTAP